VRFVHVEKTRCQQEQLREEVSKVYVFETSSLSQLENIGVAEYLYPCPSTFYRGNYLKKEN
jgi:hypothetical protein